MTRYVTAAGQGVTFEDVRNAIDAVAPSEGDVLVGTIAQEWLKQGLQQGLQQGERTGEARGLRQGLLSGIELALELRLGVEGLRILPEILRIEDVGVLKAVHEGIRTVTRAEELRQLYQTN